MSSLWYSAASPLTFSCCAFFWLMRLRLRCSTVGVTSLGHDKQVGQWGTKVVFPLLEIIAKRAVSGQAEEHSAVTLTLWLASSSYYEASAGSTTALTPVRTSGA